MTTDVVKVLKPEQLCDEIIQKIEQNNNGLYLLFKLMGNGFAWRFLLLI